MALTYSPDLLARAQAYVAQELTSKRTADGLGEIAALYAAITGQTVGGCRQCQYSDYHSSILAYIRAATPLYTSSPMADSQYMFAPGYESQSFVHERYAQAVTADSLTDEAAEFFIANGFSHAFLKAGKPVAVPALVAPTPAADEPPAKPRVKADWQQRYRQIIGADADDKFTIAELEQAIADAQADVAAARD